MFFRLKLSLRKQLALVIGCAVIALLISHFSGFEPRLRMNFSMLIAGSISGALLFISLATTHLMFLAIFQRHYAPALEWLVACAGRMSKLSMFGAGIAAGAGESLLLRGFVFGALMHFSALPGGILTALVVHLIIVSLCYISDRESLPLIPIYAAEGTVYALLFAYTRSLFMIAVAHAIVQTLSLYILSKTDQKRINYVLSLGKRFRVTSVFRHQQRFNS